MKKFLTFIGVTMAIIFVISTWALPVSAILFFLNNL